VGGPAREGRLPALIGGCGGRFERADQNGWTAAMCAARHEHPACLSIIEVEIERRALAAVAANGIQAARSALMI
jgi:hypothetical protein